MTNTMVAFFMIHLNRFKEAFNALIGDWVGVLVTDGCGLYRKWVGLRQTCLAHLVRKAREISEKADPRTVQSICSENQQALQHWRGFAPLFAVCLRNSCQ